MNIQSLTLMNGQVFSISATSLMGQSLGKRRPDMAQAYTSRCRRAGMIVAIMLGISFILFGRPLSSLYTNDEACIAICVEIFWIVAFIQPFQSSQVHWSPERCAEPETRSLSASLPSLR